MLADTVVLPFQPGFYSQYSAQAFLHSSVPYLTSQKSTRPSFRGVIQSQYVRHLIIRATRNLLNSPRSLLPTSSEMRSHSCLHSICLYLLYVPSNSLPILSSSLFDLAFDANHMGFPQGLPSAWLPKSSNLT